MKSQATVILLPWLSRAEESDHHTSNFSHRCPPSPSFSSLFTLPPSSSIAIASTRERPSCRRHHHRQQQPSARVLNFNNLSPFFTFSIFPATMKSQTAAIVIVLFLHHRPFWHHKTSSFSLPSLPFRHTRTVILPSSRPRALFFFVSGSCHFILHFWRLSPSFLDSVLAITPPSSPSSSLIVVQASRIGTLPSLYYRVESTVTVEFSKLPWSVHIPSHLHHKQ